MPPISNTAGKTKMFRCLVELVNMAKVGEHLHCIAVHLRCLRCVSLHHFRALLAY